jgi:hypothetical protein
MDLLWKQPSEKYPISTDTRFSYLIKGSDYIVASNADGDTEVIGYDKEDNVVTDDIIVSGSMEIDDKKITCTLYAGTEDLSPYKVTFIARTNLVKTFEYDLRVYIGEE